MIPFPIRGLAHVAHLPPLDLEGCIGDLPMLERPIPEHLTIMSTSTCAPYPGRTLRAVLLEGMRDASERPLRLVDTVTAAMEHMSRHGGEIHVVTAGPSLQARGMEKTIAMCGLECQMVSLEPRTTATRPRLALSDRIAIVGMSGRFPQSDTIHEFWNMILKGIDTHTEIPPDRFPVQDWFDATGEAKNSTSARHGCFINNPGKFDTRLFNVSPREAFQMDPVQRLLLMTTHEALDDAGFNNSSASTPNLDDRPKVGVYVGQCTEQWRDICVKHGVDIFSITGLLRAFAPGRLNYHFKFEGPSYSLDAACSSSSTAIGLACSALKDGSIDMAVAGGAQLSNTPLEFSGLSKAGFLSTTGGCKTFRPDADGYCRGEGVGMVVLKRLDDALRDNDNIHSVISGWARNHSANAISITHPHAETQQKLYNKVLQQAGMSPGDVGYIEMHGTGTQAGDSAEMSSVTSVFAQRRSESNPLYVGAVKANVGHSEAAAGVTAVIKGSLMLKSGIIPPQVGMPGELNPAFPNLANLNVHIASKQVSFAGKNRSVFVNNFDAAGGNTCLMLEEAPPPSEKVADPRDWHVVTCSGRTLAALRGNKRKLLDFLVANSSGGSLSLADVAYSTTARRTHEMLRSGYVGSSVSHIIQQLRADVQSSEKDFKKIPPKGATVFLFTGQGSHYAGMGAQLYRSSTRFRSKLNSLVSMSRLLGLPPFLDIIADENVDVQGKTTAQVQLAVLCLELALADLWISWGMSPSVVMGHSLGEYAALCVAGVLSPADTLFIVGTRAILIQDRLTEGEFAMLSAMESADIVQKHLAVSGYGRTCQISCYNATRSTVVSGTVEDLQRLEGFLGSKGVRTKFLPVPYGFHSPQLDTVLEDLEACATSLQFAAPKIPVLSTMTGQLVQAGDGRAFNAAYLARQARDPVRFVDALENLMAQRAVPVSQHNLWLEIGPNPVCVGLVRSTLEVVPTNRAFASLKAGESVHKTVCSALSQAYQAGVQIDWPAFHQDCMNLRSVRFLDGIPTYAFDTKDYWSVYDMDTSPVASSLPPHQASRRSSEAPPAREPARPRFRPTSSLQKVREEIVTADEISVTFESDAADEKLSEAICGHLVNGAALCPTSVFSDMAVGAARYVWELASHASSVKDNNSSNDKKAKVIAMPALSIRDLDIFNALVLEPRPSASRRAQQQLIRVSVTTTSKPEKLDGLRVTFSSRGGNSGSEFQDNGRCHITFGDAQRLKAAWSKNSHLVKARIDAMMSPQRADTMVRLQRAYVYKLFNSIVRYDEKYHGLHEVFMDEAMQDAVAVVKLKPRQALASAGTWTLSPYWSDAIVHLAGFVMNGSSRNKENTAHISGGLDCMTLADDLSDDKTYYSYVRMRAGEKKGASIGDVYVLDGEAIIAFAEGVKFQQLPLSILNVVLGIGNHNHSTGPGSHAPMVHAPPPAAAAKKSAALGSPAAIVAPTPRQASARPSFVQQHDDEADRRDSYVSVALTTPTKTFSSASSGPASSRSSPPSSTSRSDKTYDNDNAKIVDALLDAVISETGFDVADMDDNTEFSDMGVDSLMSIAIIDSVKRNTGITLPVSLFLDLTTVGDFRTKFASNSNSVSPGNQSPVASVPPQQQQPDRKASVHFPEVAVHAPSVKSDEPRQGSRPSSRPPSSHVFSPRTEEFEEVEIPSDHDHDNEQYEDHEYPADDGGVMQEEEEEAEEEEVRPGMTGVFQMTKFRRGSTPLGVDDHMRDRPFVLDLDKYASNVVLMQGDPRSAQTPLFLICDGAGSAAAYVHMPSLASGTPVYALESPFLRRPLDFTCSLEQVALLYKAALKRVRPAGPYLVGGWSAGAVYAYEVCRQLQATGQVEDRVQGLILIDMKVPRPNLSIAPPTMDAVGQANLVTHVHGERGGAHLDNTNTTEMAQVVKEHLLASALCVRKYEPRPLRRRPLGGTYIIWARWGLCDTLRNASDIEDIGRGLPADPAGKNVMFDNDLDMRTFLFSKRRVFGMNGWDKLVGGAEGLETAVIDGDHFSIVRKPHVSSSPYNKTHP